MADQFNVTASYDRSPPNYNAGETIRVAIAGTNTHTRWVWFRKVVTVEEVFIDAAAGAKLTLGGRQWGVDPTRKILTAVA